MRVIATSIFNRAGTGHIWVDHSTNSKLARSLCGLVERRSNLDAFGVIAPCTKCPKREKSK